jgi:hypothetical protein
MSLRNTKFNVTEDIAQGVALESVCILLQDKL